MIGVKHKGGFKNLESFLDKAQNINKKIDIIINKYGQQGVKTLSKRTPIDTGEAASSWRYKVGTHNGNATLEFHNDDVNKGVPIVILIEHGHATRDGGFVQGRPFIHRSIQPIFDKIASEIGKEVRKL